MMKTNGDRIRSMTDEELARFLASDDAQACGHCDFYNSKTHRCDLEGPCVKELAAVMLEGWLAEKVWPEGVKKSG